MSGELRVSWLIIIFLLFALVGGYHLVRMIVTAMGRSPYVMNGGFHQPMITEPVSRGSKDGIPVAFYLVILILLAIVVLLGPEKISGLLPASIKNYQSASSEHVLFSASSSLDSESDKDDIFPPTLKPEDSDDLATFEETVQAQPEKEIEQALVLKVPSQTEFFAYKIVCGSNIKFVNSALSKYKKAYSQAQILGYGPECEYKIALYDAKTEAEVAQWVSSNNPPKGGTIIHVRVDDTKQKSLTHNYTYVKLV